MKNFTLYLLALSLAFINYSCKKEPIQDVPSTNGKADDFFTGGWTGDENDDELYQDLIGFGNGNLPASVDLTPLLPPVGNQGLTGTCVAWAAGYYTKTALAAKDGNLSSSELRDPDFQHSPKDLFWSIPNNLKGPNCNGTQFQFALDALMGRGVASMGTVPFQSLGDCSSQPQSSWTAEAADKRIESYRMLPVDATTIKQKLAEGRPLIWGAFVSRAFQSWRGSQVMTEQYILDGTNGPANGHAMTIVGYDDSRGAFRIVNSWGTNWGDSGFAWVSYKLMTNPSFSKYIFVAYNKVGNNGPNPNTNGNTTSGIDLVVDVLNDNDDPDQSNALHRKLVFDIKNIGPEDVDDAWDGWNNLYIYFNARNANDFGVILHQHINDWMGSPGELGVYDDGIGGWSSYWFNVELGGKEQLANAFFNKNTNFSWGYKSPNITGEYYLAMIADAFDKVKESNESHNIKLVTGQNGRPIRFTNGIGQGFHSGAAGGRNSQQDANAYKPEVILNFIAGLKASGQLKKMATNAAALPPTAKVD